MQVTDLNEKLDAEITKADKLEIDNKKISSKLAALQREREAILQERDKLRDTVDELRCSTVTTGLYLLYGELSLMRNFLLNVS